MSLERIVHLRKYSINQLSRPAYPRKPILKPLKVTTSAQGSIRTAKYNTIANTSLNILLAFKDSTLRKRASTGSLHSRMDRSVSAKNPISENYSKNSPAGIIAAVSNEYKSPSLGCCCLTSCTCRIIERYFLNEFHGYLDGAADWNSEQVANSKAVRFDHVDIYSFSDDEDSDDTLSLCEGLSWIDDLEVEVEDHGKRTRG
ncbi:hypothetical protein LOZ53_001586 [Ophidiomyces ophidiicola]|nr:hypothetical protein LOZ55_000915 [Ophidiomyces ophidiicola]KAI1990505.1 hypothetical protein LOZ51_004856 [Ophidiomyces ophidiicola]KAI1994321.1 hypothetical protein LOZ54_000991 [Ophidiomyces ophidiicola]KAI1995014.1 hypothetical protein LOZ53_001586 [Ophidiomyces ophidiicola]